jgi:hypothetical protein
MKAEWLFLRIHHEFLGFYMNSMILPLEDILAISGLAKKLLVWCIGRV